MQSPILSQTPGFSDLAVVTVTTRNYLYRTRALFESVQHFLPGSLGIACCADSLQGTGDPANENFKVVEAASLQLPRYSQLAFALNATALCCALKPHAIKFVLRDTRIRRVLYIDNDIGLYRTPVELLALLEAHSFVLTPHHLNPLSVGTRPNETVLLPFGIYNAGLFAVKQSKEVSDFIDWWGDWMLDPRHLDSLWAYDQTWLNYVPVYCPQSCVLRDPSYNVAFWNLPERDFKMNEESFYCGEKPLTAFHLSNFNEDHPESLFWPARKCNYPSTKATRSVASDIVAKWARNGRDQCLAYGYGYANWSNGEPIKFEEREKMKGLWDDLPQELNLWAPGFASDELEAYRIQSAKSCRRILNKILDISPRKVINHLRGRD